MGTLPLKRDHRFKQGIFKPKNVEKYVGSKPYAIYRSGLELQYFRILDANPNVVKWGSEEIVVPYFFNQGWHNYYIDLFAIFKFGNELKKYMIELKPYGQTIEPVKTPRKRKTTFMYECLQWNQNQAKWSSAKKYAEQMGFEFHILTEKDLKR